MPHAANGVKRFRALALSMAGVSFLGVVDAAYLTVHRIQGSNVPCTITHACDTVLHSHYSTILHIPVVMIGVAYYSMILLGAWAYLEYGSRLYFKITAATTVIGLLFSAWFVYVQLALLHAICQYCMVSALTSTLLFILGLLVLKTSAPSPLPSADVQE